MFQGTRSKLRRKKSEEKDPKEEMLSFQLEDISVLIDLY